MTTIVNEASSGGCDAPCAPSLPPRHQGLWTAITAIEVIAACAFVLLDLVVPTLVLLAMACVSLVLRRTGFASLGFHRSSVSLIPKMLAFAAACGRCSSSA